MTLPALTLAAALVLPLCQNPGPLAIPGPTTLREQVEGWTWRDGYVWYEEEW